MCYYYLTEVVGVIADKLEVSSNAKARLLRGCDVCLWEQEFEITMSNDAFIKQPWLMSDIHTWILKFAATRVMCNSLVYQLKLMLP